MLKRLLPFAAILISFVAVFGGGAKAESVTLGNYIVVLNDSVADPGAVAAQHARLYGGQVSFTYRHALKGYAVTLPTNRLAALEANPLVRFVSEDGEVTAAARPAPCTDLTQCQRISRGVNRIDGDLSSTRSGDGKGSVNINVAVIDSGIDIDHPDLNVGGGTDCTQGANSFDDDSGHGTLVAGFIGAKDNDFGAVGVAPGARLWAVKVLDKHLAASDAKVICGVDWVTSTRRDADPTNDIAVANMSLAGTNPHGDDGNCGLTNNDAFHLALCNSIAAGVTYVVGAGNGSMDFQDIKPAAYSEVLTATAMADFDGQSGGLAAAIPGCSGLGADDSFATFSNFATLLEDQVHTLAAPGVCIGSTYLNGSYAVSSGTSFASPLVAGTVALCIASGPCAGLTPTQMIQKIAGDAAAYNNSHPNYGFVGDPLRPEARKYYGYLIRAGLY